MKSTRAWIVVAFLTVMVCAGVSVFVFGIKQQAPVIPCGKMDRNCMHLAISKSPIIQDSFWRDLPIAPGALNIVHADTDVLQYINNMNALDGLDSVTTPAVASDDFIADLNAAWLNLPDSVKRLSDRKLTAVVLVEHLGSSGLTVAIRDKTGRKAKGFIVLDYGVLASAMANSWVSWRDRTPFMKDDEIRLSVRLEDDVHNSRSNALQYLLLHEMAHVISVGRDLVPDWDLVPSQVSNAENMMFFKQSWTISLADNTYRSVFDGDLFFDRNLIRFYSVQKLPAIYQFPVYEWLGSTSFPTLYAVINPNDDWAESFCNYVHVVLLGKPYIVTVATSSNAIEMHACWNESRCAGKRLLIEQLIESNSR